MVCCIGNGDVYFTPCFWTECDFGVVTFLIARCKCATREAIMHDLRFRYSNWSPHTNVDWTQWVARLTGPNGWQGEQLQKRRGSKGRRSHTAPSHFTLREVALTSRGCLNPCPWLQVHCTLSHVTVRLASWLRLPFLSTLRSGRQPLGHAGNWHDSARSEQKRSLTGHRQRRSRITLAPCQIMVSLSVRLLPEHTPPPPRRDGHYQFD